MCVLFVYCCKRAPHNLTPMYRRGYPRISPERVPYPQQCCCANNPLYTNTHKRMRTHLCLRCSSSISRIHALQPTRSASSWYLNALFSRASFSSPATAARTAAASCTARSRADTSADQPSSAPMAMSLACQCSCCSSSYDRVVSRSSESRRAVCAASSSACAMAEAFAASAACVQGQGLHML